MKYLLAKKYELNRIMNYRLTIKHFSESVGISGLPSTVSKELAGDLTYRLREIADACSQFLRHSRSVLSSIN